MPSVSIQRVPERTEQTQSLLAEAEQLLNRVRERAYQIFSSNGHRDGHALEDWFQAERDLLWTPPAELAENESAFEIRVALPGLTQAQVSVTALNQQIIVKGRSVPAAAQAGTLHFSDFPGQEAMRTFDLPSGVNVDKVTAKLERGVLTISAPKAAAEQKVVPVSAAA